MTLWSKINIEYYSGTTNIKFVGKHKTIGAADNDEGWYVQRLTYDGSNNITQVDGPALGPWTGRETLV